MSSPPRAIQQSAEEDDFTARQPKRIEIQTSVPIFPKALPLKSIKLNPFSKAPMKKPVTSPFSSLSGGTKRNSLVADAHKIKPNPLDLNDETQELSEEAANLSRMKKMKFIQDLDVSGTDSMVVDQTEEKKDEEDALDAFMVDVNSAVQKLKQDDIKAGKITSSNAGVRTTSIENEEIGEEEEEEEDIMEAATKKIAAKRKDISSVDHSRMNYERKPDVMISLSILYYYNLAFQKDFYIEPPELAVLTDAEVDIKRAELGGIKVVGKACPKPIERWAQMGLPPGVNDIIGSKLKFEKPTAIQAQTIPAIMNGRDVIGIAKTGSGKVLLDIKMVSNNRNLKSYYLDSWIFAANASSCQGPTTRQCPRRTHRTYNDSHS
jgi:hypothetical protein